MKIFNYFENFFFIYPYVFLCFIIMGTLMNDFSFLPSFLPSFLVLSLSLSTLSLSLNSLSIRTFRLTQCCSVLHSLHLSLSLSTIKVCHHFFSHLTKSQQFLVSSIQLVRFHHDHFCTTTFSLSSSH